MTVVRNTLDHVVDVVPDGIIAAYGLKNIDVTLPRNAQLLADGVLVLYDIAAPPEPPAYVDTAVAARQRYMAQPVAFLLDIHTADPDVPQILGTNGLPLTLEDVGAASTDALLTVADQFASSAELSAEAAARAAADTTLTTNLAAKADLIGGYVPTSQIPPIALTQPFPVADRAAMLALTAEPGDVAIVASDNDSKPHTYMLRVAGASTYANWQQLDPAVAGAVTLVNGQSGIVVLGYADVGAAAASHTHAQSDVTNLVTDLAAKIPKTLVDAKGDLLTATADDTPARLAAGSNGQTLFADSTQSTGLRWGTAAKTRNYGHSVAYPADVAVPTTNNFIIAEFDVPTLATGQAISLSKVRYRITGSGTCTLKLRINGVDATGFTSLACTTTEQVLDPTDIVMASGDQVSVCATGTAATPLGLKVFVEFAETIA